MNPWPRILLVIAWIATLLGAYWLGYNNGAEDLAECGLAILGEPGYHGGACETVEFWTGQDIR